MRAAGGSRVLGLLLLAKQKGGLTPEPGGFEGFDAVPVVKGSGSLPAI
jgi:hypothetical protein